MTRRYPTVKGYAISIDQNPPQRFEVNPSPDYLAQNYRKIHPLFVPRLLINLGAGHISMRYDFRVPPP